MAGYRPKNLDELNSMFDKTLAAERAIKKGTSLVEKTTENAVITNATEDIDRIAEEVKQSMGISDEINDFIAKFTYEKPEEEKNDSKPKPQMTVLVPEQPKAEKASFELFENTPEADFSVQQAEQEMSKADSGDLMDEYMRIMNDDEDDDIPRKKLSRKEKKKLKMMEKREAEKSAQQEAPAEPEKEQLSEPAAQEEQESFYDFSSEAGDEKSEPQQSIVLNENDEEEFIAPEYISSAPESAEQTVPQAEDTDNDFSFPENYTPDWMKEEEETEEIARPKKTKAEKKESNHIFVKGLLCLLLAVLVFIGSTATVFKTLVPVNTGKAANDTLYFFTANKDYSDLGINKGDFIITEKRYTQDGDVFAYVDYSSKTFEFGRRNDSITNDDGVVLLVTENEGSRTLVSRDDCKGVIFAVYPTIGTFISILSDNFIVIMAAVAVSALIIILTLVLAFRSKDKEKANRKGSSKKEAKELPEEPEIEELEEIDLFTTIG